MAGADELTDVMARVQTWPVTLRIALAHRILETLEPATGAARAPIARSVQELIGLGTGATPPPDDETVRQWIDERRVEKYG